MTSTPSTSAAGSPSHPLDLDLVRRALAGDEAARAGLTDRLACIARVVAYRNRRCAHPLEHQELGDVAQDALEVAWRRLPSFEGRAALETWAYRVACNVHRSAQRKQMRLARRTLQPLEASQIVDRGSAEGHAEADQLETLHGVLAELGDADAALLRLRHYDSLSFVEIAESLGISASGVKHRYRVALQRLRDAMGHAGAGQPRPATGPGTEA